MDLLNSRISTGQTFHVTAVLLFFLVSTGWILKNNYPALPEPLLLRAELSEGKAGLAGPLIVTGRFSAGDFLFIEWVQPGQIVFCYNSWGSSETLRSKPVEIKGGQPLQLNITMPSILAGPRNLRLECNGIVMLEGSPRSYPAGRDEISFGKNLFGSTLCGKKLPGKLFLNNGKILQGSPAAFFTVTERFQYWVAHCWGKILVLLTASVILFRLTLPSQRPVRLWQEQHPLDVALLRFSRFIFRIDTGSFLVGFVLCLAGLSYAGRQSSTSPYIVNFERFYPHLATESYFFPTSSLMASLAESKLAPGKTLVILGGSSVSNGVGQPASQTWTQALRKELGPSYEVVNFALRGGQPSEGGGVAAEILRRKGHKVFYVADMFPGQNGQPDGAAIYRYIFWDAYYKGLLTDEPKRREFLRKRTPAQNDQSLLVETQLSMWFNSWSYSLDFWNKVGYSKFFSVWNNYMTPFYEPKNKSVDPEPEPQPMNIRYLDSEEAELKLVQKSVDNFYSKLPAGSIELPASDLSKFRGQSNANFPDEVKTDMLLYTVGYSPFYRDKLSAIDQQRIKRIYSLQKEGMEKEGYQFINAMEAMRAEDFVDRCHLSPSGGQKLAKIIAAKIKEMNPSPSLTPHEK